MKNSPDKKLMIKRGLKYLVLGLAVMLSLKFVPSNELNNKEIFMIVTVSCIVFAVLDMYAPHVVIDN